MSKRLQSRILAGPFDGHLSHKAVQDAFVSYGKVLYGAWYLHTPDGLQTYGFVEFDNEADARNAIRALLTGGFLVYGENLRMINVAAEGALPMRLEEWNQNLNLGWTYHGEATNAGDEGTLKDPSSRLEPYDPAHLEMESSRSIKLEDLETEDTDRSQAGAQRIPSRLEPCENAIPHTESSRHIKLQDIENVDAGDDSKTEAQTPPSHTKLYDPADVNDDAAMCVQFGDDADINTGGRGRAAGSLPLFAVHRHASVYVPDTNQPAVAPR